MVPATVTSSSHDDNSKEKRHRFSRMLQLPGWPSVAGLLAVFVLGSLVVRQRQMRTSTLTSDRSQPELEQLQLDVEEPSGFESLEDALSKLERSEARSETRSGKAGVKVNKPTGPKKAKKSRRASVEVPQLDPEEKARLEKEESLHVDFSKRLHEERERKLDYDVKTVKAEFKKEYGDDSQALLCSGCKVVAARLTSELDTHDVHEQESPAHMIQAKRKAIDATCGSLRHLRVVTGDDTSRPRFEASESPDDDGSGQVSSQRLCAAILEESKFDVLARLIQQKVGKGLGPAASGNWGRWLCAERTKLCKRSEVPEDDEAEDDS